MKTDFSPSFCHLSALLLLGAGAVPAATIFGLGESGGNIFQFDSAAPGTVTNNQSLTGVPAGQSPRAIDFRPSNGLLYLLSTGATTSDARLYTINPVTGAVTVLGSLVLPGATGLRHSLDWNPVTDRLHIVSASSRTQYEINPVGLGVTTLATFAAGTFMSDLAFDNNFTGSATTTSYVYDYNADELLRVTSPGAASTVSVGPPFAPNGTLTASQGLDIDAAGTAWFNTDFFDGPLAAGGSDYLFTLNLTTGASTLLGAIGLPTLDISVQPIPEPAAAGLMGAAALLMLRRRRA